MLGVWFELFLFINKIVDNIAVKDLKKKLRMKIKDGCRWPYNCWWAGTILGRTQIDHKLNISDKFKTSDQWS